MYIRITHKVNIAKICNAEAFLIASEIIHTIALLIYQLIIISLLKQFSINIYLTFTPASAQLHLNSVKIIINSNSIPVDARSPHSHRLIFFIWSTLNSVYIKPKFQLSQQKGMDFSFSFFFFFWIKLLRILHLANEKIPLNKLELLCLIIN